MHTKAEVIISISLLIFFTIFDHARAEDEIAVSNAIPRQNELANAANSLGYNIMSKMLTDTDKNIVLSPTGISGILAMALAGSVGKTYDELAKALGFSQDIEINRQNHETFGDLLKNLNSEKTSSKTMYADAIFIDAKTKLREIYQSYVHRVYNGEAQSVDFADTEKTQTLINQWVSNNTNGKLSDFLKKPLPIETKAALVSALYFSGQWATPFVPEYTLKMPFKRTNDEVMTDMMLNLGNFNYTLKNNVEMIALPYNDSETVLYALKPHRPEKLNLSEILSTLDYEKINELVDQLTVQKCVIRFPKMDIKFFANLEDSLKSLGVETIFNAQEANLALMIDDNNVDKNKTEILSRFADGDTTIEKNNLRSVIDNLPNPHVYIDSIIHDVRIKIDEYGTEAVAATAGIIARSAKNFYANSPFYMFIRNEKTKLVTFSAAIFDPTK